MKLTMVGAHMTPEELDALFQLMVTYAKAGHDLEEVRDSIVGHVSVTQPRDEAIEA